MAPIRRAAQRPDFASHPSDLELITTHLIPRVTTGVRPGKFIHDADVYAARPEDLAAAYAPATASDGLEAWYFFTTLRAKSRRGQRKSRTVGSGDHACWHSERAPKPLFAGIAHTRRQIGYRQNFSFATKDKNDGRLVRYGWLMAEIGLNPDADEEQLVLCKVYRSPRVQRSTAPAAAKTAIARGKQASQDSASDSASASSQERTPRPALVSASTSGTLSMESDSDQDSTSQGGGVIGTSPSATPPRIPSPRVDPQIAVSPAPRPDVASHPSNPVLIKSYLTPRVASGQHPCGFTHDVDVYTASPAALTSRYSPAMASDGEKAWYFFTMLPAKSARGQRRPRTVGTGEGCWHSEAGVKPVVDGDHPIGWSQFFSFMTKEEGQRVRSTRTGWIMVEIGLDHGQQDGGCSDELVLCKVYRSPRAGPVEEAEPRPAPRRKRKAGDNNSGPVLTLGPTPGAKNSTAEATTSSARKKKAKNTNTGPVLRPARGVLKITTPATSGRNKKNTSAACPVQLCTRCRIETAESHSGTAVDAEEDGSETDLDSMTDDESGAPHGHEEAGESSASARRFYRFV